VTFTLAVWAGREQAGPTLSLHQRRIVEDFDERVDRCTRDVGRIGLCEPVVARVRLEDTGDNPVQRFIVLLAAGFVAEARVLAQMLQPQRGGQVRQRAGGDDAPLRYQRTRAHRRARRSDGAAGDGRLRRRYRRPVVARLRDRRHRNLLLRRQAAPDRHRRDLQEPGKRTFWAALKTAAIMFLFEKNPARRAAALPGARAPCPRSASTR